MICGWTLTYKNTIHMRIRKRYHKNMFAPFLRAMTIIIDFVRSSSVYLSSIFIYTHIKSRYVNHDVLLCAYPHLQDVNVNGVSHQVSTRRRDGTGSRMHYDGNTPIKLAKKDERSIIKCYNCIIISKVTGILGGEQKLYDRFSYEVRSLKKSVWVCTLHAFCGCCCCLLLTKTTQTSSKREK